MKWRAEWAATVNAQGVMMAEAVAELRQVEAGWVPPVVQPGVERTSCTHDGESGVCLTLPCVCAELLHAAPPALIFVPGQGWQAPQVTRRGRPG